MPDGLAVLAALDAEHVEILARLTLFRDGTVQCRPIPELRLLLNELHDTLTYHFKLEQEAMRTLRYGGLWDHADDHLVIWHSFLRLTDECERAQYTAGAGLLMFNSMLSLLTRHIEKFDRDFFVFARAKLVK